MCGWQMGKICNLTLCLFVHADDIASHGMLCVVLYVAEYGLNLHVLSSSLWSKSKIKYIQCAVSCQIRWKTLDIPDLGKRMS